ncbi:MAG: JAB domain-containing protein [Spirochaetia bacterium]
MPLQSDQKDSLSPLEKLRKQGSENLSNTELILLALGKKNLQTKDAPIIKKIIEIIKRSHGEMAYLEDLLLINNLDVEDAASIIACLQLSRRYFFPQLKMMESPDQVYKLLLKKYADSYEEAFICITLNAAQEVLRIREVSRGIVNKVMVQPREVFAGALIDRATAMIVAHNHPSGNVLPSEEDIAITKRLMQSGKILGIPVLDHIIFAEKNYFSFRENGKMD